MINGLSRKNRHCFDRKTLDARSLFSFITASSWYHSQTWTSGIFDIFAIWKVSGLNLTDLYTPQIANSELHLPVAGVKVFDQVWLGDDGVKIVAVNGFNLSSPTRCSKYWHQISSAGCLFVGFSQPKCSTGVPNNRKYTHNKPDPMWNVPGFYAASLLSACERCFTDARVPSLGQFFGYRLCGHSTNYRS